MIAKLCEYSKSSRNIVNRFLETLSKTILNKTKFSRPIDIIRSEFLGRISGHKNITELLQKDPQTLLILNTEINVSYPYIYDRLTKIRKIIIFQPTYASSGSRATGRSLFRQLRAYGGTHAGQGTPPSQGPPLPHALRRGERRQANSPHLHTFGVWKETGVPRGNLRRRGENLPTPPRQGLRLGIDSFSHECCHKTTLNDTTLSGDLLYNKHH